MVAVPVDAHCAKPEFVSIVAMPDGVMDQVALNGVTVVGGLLYVPVAVNWTPPNG